MRVVYRTESVERAYFARDLLRQHGIAAEVGNEALAWARGGVPADASTLLTVWVADEARAEEAERLLEEAQPPAARGAWRCPGCGERLEGAFSACWRCGAERDPAAPA